MKINEKKRNDWNGMEQNDTEKDRSVKCKKI